MNKFKFRYQNIFTRIERFVVMASIQMNIAPYF